LRLELTVAVVSFMTPIKKMKKGLCSNFLANSKTGSKIPMFISGGTVKFPPHKTPLIMIGPGTGCAMFKSMLEEREFEREKKNEVGENAFFFGVRHEKLDYLHSESWKGFVKNGTLSTYSVAFSRDQSKKIYVQHKMLEHSTTIFKMIKDGAVVILSGSSNRLPVDVKDALTEIFEKEGNMTKKEAEDFLKELTKLKKYQEETWG
jgi:sulfite reductase alpha subunit-like flavoprotein